MIVGRVFVVLIVIGGMIVNAAVETSVIRPGPCASQQPSYLLAANSAAFVRFEPGRDGDESGVIVFRRQATSGWASQRLLRRFDLRLDEDGPTIVNSGAFCVDRR